jgi:beta-galactosidase
MKQKSIIILLLVALGAIAAIVAEVLNPRTTPRKVLFDSNWYFIEGSHPEAINYDASKEQDTLRWQRITLPHDFAALPRDRRINNVPDTMEMIGPFAQTSPGKASTGWTLGGEGWYVKKLKLKNEKYTINSNKRVGLYFEGAYNQTRVWVNGQEVGSNMYGYSSFRFDITDFLIRDAKGHFNGEVDNVITVQVVNEGRNSRWYAGAGIYRHVWLYITDPLKLDSWQTFARTTQLTDISDDYQTAAEAEIDVSTCIADLPDDAIPDEGIVHYKIEIIAPDGNTIAAQAEDVAIIEDRKAPFEKKLKVKNAYLWSCDHPVLYTLRISVHHGESADEIKIPIGIRTIEFTAENGFLLNGRKTLLRGACVHHDNGLLGARAYDRAEQRKIELLKQAGFNAIRGSHNPMSETFMHECDRQGMLVIDEAFDMWHRTKNKQDYHLYFDSLSTHDMQTLVRRDRNHPSVIMYSIGNEIPERADSLGIVIAARLRGNILDLDDTRPVTMGINSIWNKDRTRRLSIEPATRSLDVSGYNYRVWNYEPEHKTAPRRVMYGSETVACELASDWRRVEDLPWVIGDFIWTGMDYLGEAGISNCLTKDAQENVHFFMPWPWYNGWCGDLDLIGQRKPQSYYHDVVCGDYPLAINVEPSRKGGERPSISYWGWMDEEHQWYQPGCEGDSVRVNVYSRDTLVSLFLNDSLVAEVHVNDTTYMGHAMVKYEPGTLQAKNHNEVSLVRGDSAHFSHSHWPKLSPAKLVTPGKPTALRLTAQNTTLKAGGQDLRYVLIELVDSRGRLVPETGRRITLQPSPAHLLIGSGNAQPDDMKSFGSFTPTLFRGQAMAILKASETPGNLLLKVSTDALKVESITFICQ